MQPNNTMPSTGTTQPNSALQDKLISYLQDMYALEDHLVQVLGEHAQDAADVPVVQQHIEQHLEETQQHRERIKTCLQSYGKQPNGVKSALTGLLGKLTGVFSGARSDVLAMNARDEYVAENFEIASYAMLIATAQALGDQKTVQAAQLNLADEVRVAKWLECHTAEAALVSLQMDGIAIPESTIVQIQADENSQMQQLWTSAEAAAKQDSAPITVRPAGATPAQSTGSLYNAGMSGTGNMAMPPVTPVDDPNDTTTQP